MNCITCFVARKYQSQIALQGVFQRAADPVAMNMRMAMYPVPRIGAPPRAKKVHIPRRRLIVTGFAESIQPVKIIHASQNLDTSVTKSRPVLSQRV